jgi:hypothetical protein
LPQAWRWKDWTDPFFIFDFLFSNSTGKLSWPI